MEKLSKQQIQKINRLKRKKFRKEQHLFIAEGNKVVSEIVTSYISIDQIIVTKQWVQKYNNYQFNGIIPLVCTSEEFNKISSQVNPDGIMAICHTPEPGQFDITTKEWVIAVDQMNDPGNLGTIIRIADWFGISTILCNQSTVDSYNPKVVQSTMGSIARVHFHYCDLLDTLQEYKGQIYTADLDGKSIYEIGNPNPGIILIGNESHGVGAAFNQLNSVKVTIPKVGNAESLNASVACGIIVSHLIR